MSDPNQRVHWIGLAGIPAKATAFGVRLAGGGAHQSKTMMFEELNLLLGTGFRAPAELSRARGYRGQYPRQEYQEFPCLNLPPHGVALRIKCTASAH